MNIVWWFSSEVIRVEVDLVYFKNTLFGMMPKQAFFIAAGDHVVAFTMLSVLHAMWKKKKGAAEDAAPLIIRWPCRFRCSGRRGR